jgi:hypothetical protein
MTNPSQLIQQLVEALEAIDRADVGLGEYENRDLTTLQQILDAALTAARTHLERPTAPAPSMAGEHEPENEPGASLASVTPQPAVEALEKNDAHPKGGQHEDKN